MTSRTCQQFYIMVSKDGWCVMPTEWRPRIFSLVSKKSAWFKVSWRGMCLNCLQKINRLSKIFSKATQWNQVYTGYIPLKAHRLNSCILFVLSKVLFIWKVCWTLNRICYKTFIKVERVYARKRYNRVIVCCEVIECTVAGWSIVHAKGQELYYRIVDLSINYVGCGLLTRNRYVNPLHSHCI